MTTRSKALKQYIEEAQYPATGSHAPGFVVQLYDMVNNSPPEMISWSAAGDFFVINADVKKVEIELLPKYFRHGRFASFVRQLNLYSFRKMNQERTSWVYKHDMFHRDRPEDLHLVRRISGIDGRKNRINKLPTSALVENNENDDMGVRVEITPVNLRKKRFASVENRVDAKKRAVGANISNFGSKCSVRLTPPYVRILPFHDEESPTAIKKQSKATASFRHSNGTLDSRSIPYKKSIQYVVGDLLTYDDEYVKELDEEGFDSIPVEAIDCSFISPQKGQEGTKSAKTDAFSPNFSPDMISRVAMAVAWPRPGKPNGDLVKASLVVLVLEGFASKEMLLINIKKIFQCSPTIATDFHCYSTALEGSAACSIFKDGKVAFSHTMSATRYSDMIHLFATFTANSLLELLPQVEDSFSSEEDLAHFRKNVIDWKVAVQSMF